MHSLFLTFPRKRGNGLSIGWFSLAGPSSKFLVRKLPSTAPRRSHVNKETQQLFRKPPAIPLFPINSGSRGSNTPSRVGSELRLEGPEIPYPNKRGDSFTRWLDGYIIMVRATISKPDSDLTGGIAPWIMRLEFDVSKSYTPTHVDPTKSHTGKKSRPRGAIETATNHHASILFD